MFRKVTHKIALGFTLLVLFIMVVGGGGLWGTDQINRKLHDITDRSLPATLGSFNQMIALQSANIALLNFLGDDQVSDDTRAPFRQTFNQQMDSFRSQQETLLPAIQHLPKLTALLQQSRSAEQAFTGAADQAMQLHEEQLRMQQRVLQKESRFRRQTNSLTTWVQQYLSRNNGGDGPGIARNMMRTLNSHLDQLILFKQNSDFPALEKALSEQKGELSRIHNDFKQADAKANRIRVLIRDINEQLYADTGLVALMRQSWQNSNRLDGQLTRTRELLSSALNSTGTFIETSQQQMTDARSEADDATSISRQLISVLLIGATALAIFIAIITVRTISRPLNEMLGKLSRVAEGDMRVEFDCSRDDEFGQLSSAMNEVVSKLSVLLRQISDGAENLSVVAERNAGISNQTRESMQSQSQQLDVTAAAATEMESMVTDVFSHTQSTLDAIQSCEQLSQDVDKYVQRTLSSIEQQASDVSSAMQHSDQLEQYSSQIGSILDTIGEIAEQTNLLALNAAIEAARAGDHGRGFAVVADEVRELASRTQNSTQEIQEMVENMQNSIGQVVAVMQKSMQQSQQCVEHASTSQSSLGDMNTRIANIREMSGQIAEAARQQSEAVEEVSRTLEQINAAAGDTAEGASTVSASSEDLLGIAQHQRELIARFQV